MKEQCKECFQQILDPNYKGPTKAAHARILKRLVHFAKTGEIGERIYDTDHADKVHWIRQSKYDGEHRPYVEADDLLTPEELISIFRALLSVSRSPIRNKPMCTSEVALRPGEILQMRIEGVKFQRSLRLGALERLMILMQNLWSLLANHYLIGFSIIHTGAIPTHLYGGPTE